MGSWGRQGTQFREPAFPPLPTTWEVLPGSHAPTGVVDMGLHTSSAGDQRGHHTWTDSSESRPFVGITLSSGSWWGVEEKALNLC